MLFYSIIVLFCQQEIQEVLATETKNLESLKPKADTLHKLGNPNGKQAVEDKLNSLTSLLDNSKQQADKDGHKTDESLAKWQDYQDALQEATDVISEAEEKLPTSVSHCAGNEELEGQLNDIKVRKSHVRLYNLFEMGEVVFPLLNEN